MWCVGADLEEGEAERGSDPTAPGREGVHILPRHGEGEGGPVQTALPVRREGQQVVHGRRPLQRPPQLASAEHEHVSDLTCQRRCVNIDILRGWWRGYEKGCLKGCYEVI